MISPFKTVQKYIKDAKKIIKQNDDNSEGYDIRDDELLEVVKILQLEHHCQLNNKNIFKESL